MKRLLLLATLAIAPGFSYGQPPEQPVPNAPKFKINRENLNSLALVGAFYNSIQRAKSYNGHLVMTKTKTVDGKVVLEKVVDWKSTWVGKGDGSCDKRRAEAYYTETVGDKKSVKEALLVDDGKTLYRHSTTRNVWSQQPHDEDSDVSQDIPFGIWMTQLLAFDQGAEFTTEVQTVPNKPSRLVVKAGTGFEFVINEETGLLESWRVSSNDGEKTELRFLELEINQPINDAAFAWKQPEGARQVPPEETEQKVEF